MSKAINDPSTRAATGSPGLVSDTLRSCTVHVPASTSNLGAGFDCVGMAIDRWLTVRASVSDRGGVAIAREGTLGELDCAPTDDLIWRGVVATCAALRRPLPRDVTMNASSNIPIARGLGSSAAAVIAGALVANELLDGGLDDSELLDIAAALEGHPDNVAPAVLGGAVLSVRASGHRYHSVQLAVHPSLRFVFAIPDFQYPTPLARSVLPATVDFSTAVSAASRSAALVAGLASADPVLLGVALDDVLHVSFRRNHIKGYDRVVDAAVTAGAIGATLSGSGSAIVAVVPAGLDERVRVAMERAWKLAGVGVESIISTPELQRARVDTNH